MNLNIYFFIFFDQSTKLHSRICVKPLLNILRGVQKPVKCPLKSDEIFQLLQPADIDRAHQKLGAEITANEIAAAMDEFIVGAVEATPDFIAPA